MACLSAILPVIDLKGGIVVRGVAGQRDQYRPVESCFTADAQPASVAMGLTERFCFRQVYVADLDAIGGAEPNWPAFVTGTVHNSSRREPIVWAMR